MEKRLFIREMTLENGLSYPSDEELVMLILGSGTKSKPVQSLAREIFAAIMSTKREKLVDELVKIEGVGKNRALAVAAALELGRRANRNPQGIINEPKDIVPFIQNYAMRPTEHLLAVSLNGAREIISIHVICSGSGNMAVLRPADIFAEAVKERASAIVVSHNHPSGSLLPSLDDIKTTEVLLDASRLLGIALLDHIIITRDGYFSFTEHNMLK